MPSSRGSSQPRDGMNPHLLRLLHWQGVLYHYRHLESPSLPPSNPKQLAREGPKGTSEAAQLLIPPGISSCLPSHFLYPAVSMVSRRLALGVDTKVVPPFPIQVVAELQAGLPVLYSSFPLASYFTHDIVYMSMLPTFSICPTISWPCCVQQCIPTSASPFFAFK